MGQSLFNGLSLSHDLRPLQIKELCDHKPAPGGGADLLWVD